MTNGGPTVRAVGVQSGGGTKGIGSGNLIIYQDFWTADKHWKIRPIT
ncbi:hypothetical protein [Actinoplanes couchii]|uniref:Uncharacterized protein n=1 Tax=Actinoplanes couchii TaxID=403638 RepID=A0ABQ3XRP4_9ACTN|nr:hypothetical protein [Actinoplanes couchii]MDR6318881.1 hypothetical protein [Actinoplanes couchii]GID61180.1 hypothetical protein Aco03nite_095840 [Actinoplanes couchii]